MIRVNLDIMLAKRHMQSGELARRIGITDANLSILKTNKGKAIRFSTLNAICRELHCQPADILEYTDEPGRTMMEKPDVMQAVPDPLAETGESRSPFTMEQKLLVPCSFITAGLLFGPVVSYDFISYLYYLAGPSTILITGWHFRKALKNNFTAYMFGLMAIIISAFCLICELTGLFEKIENTYSFCLLLFPFFCMGFCISAGIHLPCHQEGAFLKRGFKGFFVMPFTSVPKLFLAIGSLFERDREARSRRKQLFIGFLIALPVAAVVIFLLAEADATVSGIFSNIFIDEDFWDRAGDWIFWAILTFPAAMLFYSFYYGLFYRYTKLEPMCDHTIPLPTSSIVQGILTAIYAAFILLQISYLFGGTLPQQYTYSEYAVRGFTELVLTATINFVILALSIRYGKKHPVKTVLDWLLLITTILLLISAAIRLGMYINAYHLTERRIMSVWVMCLVLLISVLTAVRLVKPTFPAARTAAICFCFALVILMIIVLIPGVIPDIDTTVVIDK